MNSESKPGLPKWKGIADHPNIGHGFGDHKNAHNGSDTAKEDDRQIEAKGKAHRQSIRFLYERT
ncbi:MAG: hypothetical protein HFG69_00870 [Hungatella sp.]|nr:hypothetical protein [Hungatella sp.]